MARILVIEDNPVNLELMAYLLRAYGHAVIEAAEGSAGLALAHRERPDLVVCDLQMPVLDGLAFAGLVRADPALSRLPLVAVTAAAMVGDRERALAAGFADHIAKPIDPNTFVPLIERHLPSGSAGSPMPSTEASLGGSLLHPMHCAPRAGLVLLMVDDREMQRELKQGLLVPAGYTVLSCESAESALALLARERVDAVVSDVVMPGIGGFEFLRRLRADPATQRLPFLFLTSTACGEADRRRGLALGADDYLERPIDAQDLLLALHRLLTALRR